MKEQRKKYLFAAMVLLAAFVLWTAAVQNVDVQTVGPQGSRVGFATVNLFIHDITGVHMALYVVTDWLGLVPLGFAAGFALLGLSQWRQRKHLLKVDRSILILGIFYIIVAAVYLFFEVWVVNYRPVLIDGVLEASYPSSTTVLVLCVMPTAAMQFNARVKNAAARRFVCSAIMAFVMFMVAGRLVSGVHWFSDIVGGALLSSGLVLMYDTFSGLGEN